MKAKLLIISLLFSIFSMAQQSIYFNDFEGLTNFKPDTSGFWQKGVPAGNHILSAHSGNQVWMTILDSTYSYSFYDRYLYTPVFNVNGYEKISMSFWQALNLDTMSNGYQNWLSMANVEYRRGSSSGWIMLGYKGDPQSTSWYNNAIGGTHGWCYLDSSWFYSSYEYDNNYYGTDSLQFRFIFKTYLHNNFNSTGDGWAIDDFQINGVYYNHELAIKKIITPDVNSNIINDTVKIRVVNLGSEPSHLIALSYRIGNNPAVKEFYTGNPIPSGDSIDYTFTSLFSSPQSSFNICTYLTTYDTYKVNDTLCTSIILTNISVNKPLTITGIYPNPVKNVARISFNLMYEEKIDFDLYNSTGAVVYQTKAYFRSGSNNFSLNVADLPKGVYFLRLKADLTTIIKRIIII